MVHFKISSFLSEDPEIVPWVYVEVGCLASRTRPISKTSGRAGSVCNVWESASEDPFDVKTEATDSIVVIAIELTAAENVAVTWDVGRMSDEVAIRSEVEKTIN